MRKALASLVILLGGFTWGAVRAKDSLVPPSWLARVTQEIRESEYRFSQLQDGSWSAPNRAHDLRSRVTPEGLHLAPRVTGEDAWQLDLRLVGFGRGDVLKPAGEALVEVERDRIELERTALTERYLNDERGLEQGFTLHLEPDPGGAGKVVLELELGGDLGAIPSEDEKSVLFETAGGQPVLRYTGLRVRDAVGREIPATLAVGPGCLRIRIDDSDAVYPLEVDPLITSPAWTVDGDQSFGEFGWSVATAGDVNGDGYSDVIVGAHNYDNGQPSEGRAYVYLGSASGFASFPWIAESDKANAFFGTSVAAAGDVNGDGYGDVIVGAYQYVNGASRGAAFLWYGSAAGLGSDGTPANAGWTAQSGQASSFGGSVATAGDVNGDGYDDVLVGDNGYSNDQPREGAAFLYLGSASGLATTPAWSAEGDQTDCGFGYPVATAGDVNGDGYDDIAVGADGLDDGNTNEGAAYVWYLGPWALGTGRHVSGADRRYEGNEDYAFLGFSVATAGDVNGDGYADLIVGAYGHDFQKGLAEVFLGSTAGLASTPAWTATTTQQTLFGAAVAPAGDVNGDGYADVVVGAPSDIGNGVFGSIRFYMGSATGPSPLPDATITDVQLDSLYGTSVGTAGDVNGDGYSDVIVGAPSFTEVGNEGRAQVFLGSAAGLSAAPAWTVESNSTNAQLGFSVADAGDVNGDGYSDVIVGAPHFGVGGGAFLYEGSDQGLRTTPSWTVEGGSFWQFGYSVAAAGDVNGDGYGDVIVGADQYPGSEGDGAAFVYAGSHSGLSTSAAWTARGNQTNSAFGASVAAAGDINGDGYGDVIVGAPRFDNGQSDEGRAFVYLGSASGLATSPAWTTESNQIGARYGAAVSTAGDVNGDGYSDVIIGAPLYDYSLTDEGEAFVYHGSAQGLSTGQPDWILPGGEAGALFGGAVATAGDVNGDGYSDVIVGAQCHSAGQSCEGAAYAFYGSSFGLQPTPQWMVESNQVDAHMGNSVSSAGDVNGDGYSDVIVGSWLYDNGETDEGRAFVYYGSASGLPAVPSWTAESNQAASYFGRSVAAAGDVNGDGFGDIVVGADSYDNGETNEGRAFVYYGNAGAGLDRAPQQARADRSAPIALLGRSDSEAAFRLEALGRTPAGRGGVRLEWEVKPLGTPFDGTGVGHGGSFADTQSPSPGAGSAVPLGQTVVGLSPASVYHWRLRIASRSPFFPRSPWLALPYNARSETDLRTAAASAPFVTDVDPPPGSENQPRSTNVTVTFSEPVNATTVTGASFKLLGPGAAVVPATVTVAPSGALATLDPTATLATSTQYTVQVTSAVQDLAGTALVPSTTVFTTAAATSGGTPLPSAADQTIPPPGGSGERNGTSVAPAGDLDEDGLQDFISGAPNYPSAPTGSGAAVVYLGNDTAPDIIFTGASAGERAGMAVAGRFDFNGDGRPDLLIGAWPSDGSAPGKAYLIYFDPTDTTHYPNLADPGTPDTVSLSLVGQPGGIPGVVFTGIANGDRVGFSVAGGGRVRAGSKLALESGAVENVGGEDLVIGAPGVDVSSKIDAGTAYLIFSDPTLSGTVSLDRVANGLGNEVAGIVYQGNQPGDQVGFSVAFPGDVLGSIGDDIAIGAPYADAHSLMDAGIVFVAGGGHLTKGIIDVCVLGAASSTEGAQFLGEHAGDELGFSVAGGGDNQVNGEPDLLMGAPGYDVTSASEAVLPNAGVVFQAGGHFGKGIIDVCLVGEHSAAGLDGAAWTGESSGDQLGYSVAGLGDVTGDGYDDIALGAPFNDPPGAPDAGAVYLIDGAPSPAGKRGMIGVGTVGTTTPGEKFVGTQAGENAGTSVAGVGDFDGNGWNDFVVGAPLRNMGADTGAGTDYVVIRDDADDDGTPDHLDCASSDVQVWTVPGDVSGVRFSRSGASTNLSWLQAVPLGGTPAATTYTVYAGSRADLPNLLNLNPDSCVVAVTSSTSAPIAGNPTTGGLAWYLVRAGNSCGAGTAGDTTTAPRIQNVGCDDGIACTVDACSAGIGCAHTPNNGACDDGNLCTNDSCSPTSGCVHTNNTAPCDDGNFCTVNDACSGGACVSGSPLDCNDGNVCTNDSCSPGSGCMHANNTAPCNDGSACTSGDTCSNGQCAGTIPGQANHLVISQIQASGDGPNPLGDEFIEIYNPTLAPIDAGGMALNFKPVGSNGFPIVTFANPTTVPAHGWLLVASPDYFPGSPAPDVVYGANTLITSGGTVYLTTGGPAGTCTSPRVVDRVAWAGGDCPETAVAPGLSANNSILRKPGGGCGDGTDTGDNSADFVSQVPSAPRNRSSPPAP